MALSLSNQVRQHASDEERLSDLGTQRSLLSNTLNNTIILSEVVIILIISYIVTRRALYLSQTNIGASLACLIIKIVTFTNFRLTALLVFLSRAKTLTNALGKLQIRTYIFDTLSRSVGRGFRSATATLLL